MEICGCGDSADMFTPCGLDLCVDCAGDHLLECEVCQVERRKDELHRLGDIRREERMCFVQLRISADY